MIKNSKHIEIVRSSNKSLSSMSEASCNAIFEVLSKFFTEVGVTTVNNAKDLELLVASKPDLVFLGMEFVPTNLSLGTADPDKIWLSAYFDANNIAYTGSSRTAHELERNKHLAKQRILDSNLKTSDFLVIKKGQPLNKVDVSLDYPLFVKPANRGGGLGINSQSVVHTYQELYSKVNSINNALNSDALIEEYLPGREFSVAILKEEFSDNHLVMPIELIAPLDKFGSRILSGQIKLANAEQALEVFDSVLRIKISTFALNVFKALGARDYGRIDIRLDKLGTPQFLEANLIPSLIEGYGSFPKACILNQALDYEPMILQITNLGLSRNKASIEKILESTKIKEVFVPHETVLEQA